MSLCFLINKQATQERLIGSYIKACVVAANLILAAAKPEFGCSQTRVWGFLNMKE